MNLEGGVAQENWNRDGRGRVAEASPHFSLVTENRTAGLLTGCSEGLPALRDFARP
jgi:hypothetical protein